MQDELIVRISALFQQCCELFVFPVRAWTVCILCPAFRDSRFLHVLKYGLCRECGLLPENPSNLSAVMNSFSSQEMNHMVSVLQLFLELECLCSPVDLDRTILIFDLLALLYCANTGTHVVCHSTFYFTPLNSLMSNISQQSEPFLLFSLVNYPFLFDSKTKARIFHRQNRALQSRADENSISSGDDSGPLVVLMIRRESILEDAMIILRKMDNLGYLQYPISVNFIGEEGVDEGGLTREFFRILIKKVFCVDYGMFFYDENSHFWRFLSSDALDLSTDFYSLGLLIGLAVFNGHLLDLRFPLIFYKKLIGQETNFEDLKDVFPDICRNLKQLLDMNTDVSSLGLCFYVDSGTEFGQHSEVSLVPNGRKISVTSSNKHKYVLLYSKYLLETRVEREFSALKRGFEAACQNQYMKLFHPAELEEAICGMKVSDFVDLEEHTSYDGYTPDDQIIKYLWEILHGYSEETKRRFLIFVSGTDHVPIGGFGDLHPPFQISRLDQSTDILPMAATCIHTLSFPNYEQKDTLRSRLSASLEHI